MFDEAGIPYPEEGWTYDDLIDIGQQLTLDANGNNAASPDFDPENIVQYGIWWRNNWPRAWEDMAYSFGAELLSPDGTVASGYLNSPEVLAAMEYWQAMVHTYYFSVPTNTVSAQPGVDFMSTGQAAIHGPRGPWHLTTYSENPNLNYTTVPLPTGPAGHYGVICWSGFGINRATEHPDESWAFLKFLGTEPGQRIYAEHAMSSMPTIMEETGVATNPLFQPFIAEAAYLHPLDDMKGSKWTECVENGLRDLMMLLHSPEGADVDIQAELDAMAASADECLVN
jgi:multiple sugar transport system substrate-binding protein